MIVTVRVPKAGEKLESPKTVQEIRPREQISQKRSHISFIPLLCVCNTRHCYKIPVVTSANQLLIYISKNKKFREKTDTCTGSRFSTRVHEMETFSCVLLYNWII